MECQACKEKRPHTEEEWKNHPLNRHGGTKDWGWTHPDLKKEAEEKDKKESK